MISVGIDVSKGKSTVCILKPYGEIVASPFEVRHTESDLKYLIQMIQRLDGEIRIVMEATGIYHLPMLSSLQDQNLFVAVINPFEMKEYASRGLRRVKTDKQDSITIANYGIDNWYRLENHQGSDDVYSELKLLGRQYCHYMELHVKALLELTHMLDYTMPGVKKMLQSWSESNGKDKLSDFVERYWHFDNITAMTKDEFIEDYVSWAAEKKYHQNRSKAAELYDLASDGISTLPANTPLPGPGRRADGFISSGGVQANRQHRNGGNAQQALAGSAQKVAATLVHVHRMSPSILFCDCLLYSALYQWQLVYDNTYGGACQPNQ